MRRVAVVGAGAAGLTTAVLLAAGFGSTSTGVRLPGPGARLVAELTEGCFDPALPATVGITREDLAAILLARAREAGAVVRLSTRVAAVETADDGATLVLEHDGQSVRERYDLVVGADGIGSTVRSMLGITARPRHLPLGVWRATVPRPQEVERLEIINGGPSWFAGYAPTGRDSLYALAAGAGLDDAALTAFARRRLPRARAVVEGSVQIVDRQLGGERGDVPALMARTSVMLAERP